MPVAFPRGPGRCPERRPSCSADERCRCSHEGARRGGGSPPTPQVLRQDRGVLVGWVLPELRPLPGRPRAPAPGWGRTPARGRFPGLREGRFPAFSRPDVTESARLPPQNGGQAGGGEAGEAAGPRARLRAAPRFSAGPGRVTCRRLYILYVHGCVLKIRL